MKTKYLNLATAFIVIIAMSACKKDQSNPQESKNDPSTKILAFKNMEEYQQTLKEVSSLSSDERVAWEDAKGFKSFGRVCDEVYKNAHPENFTNIAEFNDLVVKNSNYLYLEKLANGELSLETVVSRSKDRYFLNNERMFQINQSVYKVLEQGVASTKVENVEKLKTVNEKNFLSYSKDSEIIIEANALKGYATNNQLKDVAYDCGPTAVNDYESSGNDRTEMFIDCGRSSNTQTTAWTWYSVRAKHRGGFFLPWLYCTRTISFDLKTRVDYKTVIATVPDPNLWIWNWNTASFAAHNNGTSAQILENTLYAPPVNGSVLNTGLYPYHFGGYDCWGDTPSSPTVNLECNISIL